MEPKKFAVHNQTRESALSPSVATVNAALEPLKVLKVLIEGLPANAKAGLWLTNFKGVPVARTLSPFDLVYLDKENRVILGVELSKDGEFTPPKGQPASALVLPPASLVHSKTRAGDQLEFRPAEAEEPQPAAPEKAPSEHAALMESAAPPETTPPAAAPSPHFFSSLGAPPAATRESAATAQTPAKSDPAAAPFPDILRREESAPAAYPFPDKPRSPLFRPTAPESSAPESPATEFPAPESIAPAPTWERRPPLSPAPSNELFWPKRPAATDSSRVSPSPAPIDEPQPPTQDFAIAPLPIEAPPVSIPEPTYDPGPGDYRPAPKKKYSWKVKLLRWLFPDLVIKDVDEPRERRRADRQPLNGLVAYYFTGGSPDPHKIANISVLGFYLQTDERWMPGTIVRMTLQRVGSTGEDPSDTITVNSKIVRWGSDGEGFEFILTDLDE